MDFSKIWPYLWIFRDGLWMTVQLTFFSAIFGFLIAVVLVAMGIVKNKACNVISSVYITVVRSMPMLLQLFIVYFGLPQLLGAGFNMESETAAIIALSFNGAAYYAEVLRGGILSIDAGQHEAARALGLGKIKTMLFIIFPQAGKRILPSMLSEFVLLFKETSLVSQIGVADLFYASGTVSKNAYLTFEAYIFVAVIYYVLVMAMSYGTSRLEKRLRLSD